MGQKLLECAPSLESLERHKQGELHQEASKKERKISTCSLCKKQFTSPPQLKVIECLNRIPDMLYCTRCLLFRRFAAFSLSKDVDVFSLVHAAAYLKFITLLLVYGTTTVQTKNVS